MELTNEEMAGMFGAGLENEKPEAAHEGSVWTREQADKFLSVNSFSLKSLGENVQPANVLPGKYNENQGVIIFGNEDGVFAIPSSTQARMLLESGEYVKDETIGVPALNNAETWSDAQKVSGASFDEWKKLSAEVTDGVLN